MRIDALEVSAFRGIEEARIEPAPQGLTLVHGPNEAGKSSLIEALLLLFDKPADSRHSEVKAAFPVHRDRAPRVALEFELAGARVRYQKTFGRAPATELAVEGSGAGRWTGREAHERAKELLAEALDFELFRALLLTQDGAPQAPKVGRCEGFLAVLDREAGAGDEDLRKRIAEARAVSMTPTGRARKGGPWYEARAEAQAAAEEAAALRARFEAAEEALARFETLGAELAACEAKCVELRAQLARTQADSEGLAELGRRLEAARHALELASKERAEREARLAAARELARKRARLAALLAALEERLAGLRAAADRAGELERARGELAPLAALQEEPAAGAPAGPRLEVEALRRLEFCGEAEGVLEAGARRSFDGAIAFEIPGVLRLRLEGGPPSRERRRAAAERLAARLRALGFRDYAALERAAEAAAEAARRAERLAAFLSGRRQISAGARPEPAEPGAASDGSGQPPEDDGQACGLVLGLEQDLAAAQDREPDLGELEAACAAARAAEDEARRAVASLEEEAGGRDPRALERALAEQRSALAAAERRREELARARHRLEGALGAQRADGLYERLEAAEARARAAAERAAREEGRARAWDLLHATFEEVRSARGRAFAEPLRAELERLGRAALGPDFAVELDEDLGLATRRLGGVRLPFAALSRGAREQLALLHRLACARVLARAGGPVPLILDDCFGATDPERLAAFARLLATESPDLQVLVLTCDPTRLAPLTPARSLSLPSVP